MRHSLLFAAAAACGLALALIAPAARAATTPLPLVGQADTDPGVLCWVDTAQGTTMDAKVAQGFHDLFAASQWTVGDGGLVISGKDGKPLLKASWAANQAFTFIPFHGRAGTTVINGDIYRDEKDPSQGLGILWLTAPSKDGKAVANPRIGVDLKFGGGSDAGSNPGDGGFGIF